PTNRPRLTGPYPSSHPLCGGCLTDPYCVSGNLDKILSIRSGLVTDKIVVVGSLNMDLVGCAPRIPVVGETVTGHTYFSEPGGKGANQAYAAAKLGGQVTMLGRVGDDDFGRQMKANLEQVGCDVSGLLALPDCVSGIALIFVADSGQNSIIIIPG